jgi:hypothetical protein
LKQERSSREMICIKLNSNSAAPSSSGKKSPII